MLPLFKPGDVVLVQPLGGASSALSLSPGDCAVYSLFGKDLLHRVVSVEKTGPIFSDDAGEIAPHKVPWENVVGIVVSSNPFKRGRFGLVYSKLRRVWGQYT